MARIDPIADASFPDMRARRSPGTAIAAMMPIIATTISSSISVKPSDSDTVDADAMAIHTVYGPAKQRFSIVRRKSAIRNPQVTLHL